ncbi:MAG: hypothetical protein QM729_20285 [Solirubrobacterales bacterium]
MKKRMSLAVAAVVAVSALAGVSQASAATEFGNECAANDTTIFGGFMSTGAASHLSVAAPTSGVITEWKLKTGYESITPEEEAAYGTKMSEYMVVARPTGTNQYSVIAKAEGGSVKFNALNTYLTRIPVQQGDMLGIVGSPYTLYCETTAEQDSLSYFEGSPVIGSTFLTEAPESHYGVPIVAKIEPDVDGDGYGDETQDQCPQSAAYQTACPVVTIGSKPFVVGKKAVTLYVSTSLSAPVGVTATVNLGKGKKATLKAAAKTVAAGALTPFKLTLTSKVTKALEELPKAKSLKLSIKASATNITGAASTSTSSVKLKGRATSSSTSTKHSKKS